MAFPGVDHAARSIWFQFDGVQRAAVVLGDVEALFVGTQRQAAHKRPYLDGPHHLHALDIDLTDKTWILVCDPGAGARFVRDDAVGFVGNAELPDDFACTRVEKHDQVVPIYGGRRERSVAEPGNAFGFLADGDLMNGLA